MTNFPSQRHTTGFTIVTIAFLFLVTPSISNGQGVPPANTPQNNQVAEILRSRISSLESKFEILNSQSDELKANSNMLSNQRASLLKQQDELGVSNESYSEIIRSLQSQRVELMIELAGIDARRKALLELMEQRAAEQSEKIIAPLDDLLQLETQNSKEAKQRFDSGTSSKIEYNVAMRRLLEVKVRLAEAKKNSRDITPMNSGLLDISLDRAEKLARLEKTDTILKSITAARQSLEKSVSLDRQLSVSRSRLVLLADEARELDAQIKSEQKKLDKMLKSSKH